MRIRHHGTGESLVCHAVTGGEPPWRLSSISAFDRPAWRPIAVCADTQYSQLRAVSPKTFNLVLGHRYRKVSTTITTNWVDESLYGGFVSTNYVTGTANPTNQALDTRLLLKKDEKLTTDVKVEYSFKRGLSAYVQVRNVFDSPRKEYLQGYLPQYRGVAPDVSTHSQPAVAPS